MKTLYFSFSLLVLFSQNTFSQSYELDLGQVEQHPCDVDTAITVNTHSKVRIYSTLNDEWDGDLDSSLCYTLDAVGSNNWRFTTSSVPNGRSVFFEIELDSNLILDTSTVYVFSPLFDYCHLNFGVEMFDSNGVDTVELIRNVIFDDYEPTCFATQKVEGQKLHRVVFESQGETQHINFYEPFIGPHDLSTPIIPEMVQPQTQLSWGPNLVRYWHDIYPTEDSISYTEVVPWGNPTHSTLIQFDIPDYSSLHFQEHTAMRGALVNGSDSIRHGLEVILHGNMCIPFFEVAWEGGNQLVIDGGTVDFHSPTSCNLFGKGGGLRIRSGSKFEYGHNGVGMLALKTGGEIHIEPGAELIINGPVFIYEYAEDAEPQQLYMDLPIGAKLTFAEGSSLSNQYSMDGTMRLNIYMHGGEVDLSGLNDEEKRIINLIYDEPSLRSWENLTVYPNPASNELQLLWVAEDAGIPLSYEVFDLSGKLVKSEQMFTSNPGHNRFEMDVHFLKSGIYTIRLMKEREVLARRKFVKN